MRRSPLVLLILSLLVGGGQAWTLDAPALESIAWRSLRFGSAVHVRLDACHVTVDDPLAARAGLMAAGIAVPDPLPAEAVLRLPAPAVSLLHLDEQLDGLAGIPGVSSCAPVFHRRTDASDAPEVLPDRVSVLLHDGHQGLDRDGFCRRLGLERIGDLGQLAFEARLPDGAATLGTVLPSVLADPAVRFAAPLLRESFARHYEPNDPLLPLQWHISSIHAIDVMSVWDTYTGAGIDIAVVDTGIDTLHEDLVANLDLAQSYDYFAGDGNPHAPAENHATWVAGVAAARWDNGIGVAGIAPEATIISERLIAGNISDAQIAAALLNSACDTQRIDVSNNSWGPSDGLLAGPGPLSAQALIDGVRFGRGGLGIIYVWAAGNGRGRGDVADYDGYGNARQTIDVGAVHSAGSQASFSENSNALLCCAPGGDRPFGGAFGDGAVTTTDPTGAPGQSPGDYVTTNDSVVGTSFASPCAAGVCALILDANPALSWRDVQHIIVNHSDKIDTADATWIVNGAGKEFSRRYGYGRTNARRVVDAALAWNHAPPLYDLDPAAAVAGDENYTPLAVSSGTVDVVLPEFQQLPYRHVLTVNPPSAFYVEHVELHVVIEHSHRGQLEFRVTSPAGTVHTIEKRLIDGGADYDWTFCLNGFWGEQVAGNWQVTFIDSYSGNAGTLDSFDLAFHGYRLPDPVVTALEVSTTGSALIHQGATGATLTLRGQGFIAPDPSSLPAFAGSLITIDGVAQAGTVVVDEQTLTVTIPNQATANVGTRQIGVRNPSFDGHGGDSNTMPLHVVTPQVRIISDAAVEAVLGSNFSHALQASTALLGGGAASWSKVGTTEPASYNGAITVSGSTITWNGVSSLAGEDHVAVTVQASAGASTDTQRVVIAIVPPTAITEVME